MIRFVTGPTGSGKTQFGVAKIIDELRSTDRPIVTNFALRLHPWVNGRGTAYPGLLANLHRIYGTTFDAERRIHFLRRDEDLQRFFGFRPIVPKDVEEPVHVDVVPQQDKADKDKRWEFDGRRYPGCAYFVDEAHEYFAQKDWAQIGAETQSWASQNRRSGDDAWLFSQQAELVAKPFRRQSLECYWMVNYAYRVMGPFRRADKIKYRLFCNTPPSDTDIALDSGELTYPRDLLRSSYDTAGGAGVHGGAADIGKRAKGMHWGWIPALAGTGIVASLFLLVGCDRLLSRVVTAPFHQRGLEAHAIAPRPASQPGAIQERGKADAAEENRLKRNPLARHKGDGLPVTKPDPVLVTGWYGSRVFLADGGEINARSVVKAGGRDVIIDGKLFRLAR